MATYGYFLLLYTFSTGCCGRHAECVRCRVKTHLLSFGHTFFVSMYFLVGAQTACVTPIIIQCASIPAGSYHRQGPSRAAIGPHLVPSCSTEITLCLQRLCQMCCTLINIKVIIIMLWCSVITDISDNQSYNILLLIVLVWWLDDIDSLKIWAFCGSPKPFQILPRTFYPTLRICSSSTASRRQVLNSSTWREKAPPLSTWQGT